MSFRDLRILARLARGGRVNAHELVGVYGSVGGVYGSLGRLIALGYVRKTGRGEYEITDAGLQAFAKIKREFCDEAVATVGSASQADVA